MGTGGGGREGQGERERVCVSIMAESLNVLGCSEASQSSNALQILHGYLFEWVSNYCTYKYIVGPGIDGVFLGHIIVIRWILNAGVNLAKGISPPRPVAMHRTWTTTATRGSTRSEG